MGTVVVRVIKMIDAFVLVCMYRAQLLIAPDACMECTWGLTRDHYVEHTTNSQL